MQQTLGLAPGQRVLDALVIRLNLPKRLLAKATDRLGISLKSPMPPGRTAP